MGNRLHRGGAIVTGVVGGGASDTTGPACAITSATSDPTATSPMAVTITFTNPETATAEAVTGFAEGDITAVGFTLTDFTAVSDGVYTVNAAFTAGSGTLDVAAGVCTDANGNANTAATQFTRTYIYSYSSQPAAAAGIDTYLASAAPDQKDPTGLTLIVRIGRCGLLKFDLSSIPAGSSIVSAALTLTIGSAATADSTVTINRILPANSAWTEANATWNYAVDGATRWAGDTGADGGADAGCSVSGTDFSATTLGTFNIVNGQEAGQQHVINLNLTEFAAMLASNAGMVMRGTGNQTIGPASSDHTTAAYRPKLDVTYTNP